MLKNEIKNHIVDATAQPVGRLASKVASLLIGKHRISYTPYILNNDRVTVNNASKMTVSGNKLTQKKYYRVSMHPGGLKSRKMEEVMKKNPAEVLRRTIYNMLPKNKHRAELVKHLMINN